MMSSTASEVSFEEFEGLEQFQKTKLCRDGRMPVSRQRIALRKCKKTPGSRRASRRVSLEYGGMHRRHRQHIS